MMFSEARQFLIFLQEKCLGSKLSSLSRGGISLDLGGPGKGEDFAEEVCSEA